MIKVTWQRGRVGRVDLISPEGFGDQPKVVNGFSDLMVQVFGEASGKHARSAVGMEALPFNNAVEVEMIVEVE